MGAESDRRPDLALVLVAVGGAIGQIITAPFSAGVVVLLYTDRRIRAEAFDLVLQTGAARGTGCHADSTDHLWLTPALTCRPSTSTAMPPTRPPSVNSQSPSTPKHL